MTLLAITAEQAAPAWVTGALVVHVVGGSVALLSGFVPLFVRKGGGLHRSFGLVFAMSMLVMAGGGAIVAVYHDQPLNILSAAFTGYLILTGWLTVRRSPGTVGKAEGGLMVWGGCVALAAGILAVAGVAPFGAGNGGGGTLIYAIFGGLAVLGAAADLKSLNQGGLAGPARISRHLWRMCLALFIAAASFFFGQVDEIPAPLHGPHLAIPPFLSLAALLFWMVRVRLPRRRRAPAIT